MKYSVLAALLFLSLACHQVTEYNTSEDSQVTFLRTDDFQVESTMDVFQGGRTLVPRGNSLLYVICSDGVIHRINTEGMSVDTSYSIGASSGTGYSDATVAGNGNLYVLGPGSQVIEVDLSTCSVEDQFVPSPRVEAICSSPTEDRLYFVDDVEQVIGMIRTANNSTGFTSNLWYRPADITIEPRGGRKIIVVCDNDAGSIFGVWLDMSEVSRLLSHDAYSPASCVAAYGSDSCYAVGCPRWSGGGGYIKLVSGYVDPVQTEYHTVEGHPVDITSNSFGGTGQLCVLSRTDAGSTVVTVLEFPFSYLEPQVAATVELDGFPQDIACSANGEYIIILTTH